MAGEIGGFLEKEKKEMGNLATEISPANLEQSGHAIPRKSKSHVAQCRLIEAGLSEL